MEISIRIDNQTRTLFADEKGRHIIAFNKQAAYKLGEFYLQKHGGDYNKMREEVAKLHIASIQETDEDVTIFASHMGLLIGKRGENIGNMEKFFGKKIRVVEEETVLDCLPYESNEYMFGCEPEDTLTMDDLFLPDDTHG